jgi:deoxyadenosine/deoxycytidine kinase
MADTTSKFELFTPVTEEQRKLRFLRGSIIVLEGLIGVGKSTLGRSIEKYLQELGFDARFYKEFVNEKFLSLYINDMENQSVCFQSVMLMQRFNIYREATTYAKTGGIAIVDRSLLGDFAFAKMQKKYYSDEEWEAYMSLMIKGQAIQPSYMVYLDCSPEVAFSRMQGRGFASEVDGYTLAYFNELDEYYKESMVEVADSVSVVPWEDDKYVYTGDNEYLEMEVCKNFLLSLRDL